MKERAMSFEKIALSTAAIQLSPGATAGMTVGADIASPKPAAIATGGMGTALVGGVDVAAASTCRDQAWWRGTGRLRVRLDGLLTGVTVGRAGQADKGCGRSRALSRWRGRLGCRLPLSLTIAWPGQVQHDAEPKESQQY
jgi:hypothetical protein